MEMRCKVTQPCMNSILAAKERVFIGAEFKDQRLPMCHIEMSHLFLVNSTYSGENLLAHCCHKNAAIFMPTSYNLEPRVSPALCQRLVAGPGDQPLTKSWRNSGLEIGQVIMETLDPVYSRLCGQARSPSLHGMFCLAFSGVSLGAAEKASLFFQTQSVGDGVIACK